MAFTSLGFIFLFLPLSVAIYYTLYFLGVSTKGLNLLLLIISFVFYASGEPKRMYILLVSIVFNYLFGIGISKTSDCGIIQKCILIISIMYNLGILFYYKYLLMANGALSVIMPLGLSYYTFRAVSYCVDVYWEMVTPGDSLINTALYISFFPQISMGPISRYSDFIDQIYHRKTELALFFDGVGRIVTGMFKKLVIADSLAQMINACFGMTESNRSIVFAWLCAIGYLLQLYYDFSGYTDMAIGIGALFGFKIPENFNYPYISMGATEFYNRWHITLGAWLRDYIYIPVYRACQNRKMKKMTCYLMGILLVWLFSGIWHGVGIKTICWGLYYFVFIALERIYEDHKKRKLKKMGLKKQNSTFVQKCFSHLYGFFIFLFGQLLFRSASLEQFLGFVLSMFGLTGNRVSQLEVSYYFRQNIILLLLGGILSMPIIPFLKKRFFTEKRTISFEILKIPLYGAMLVISLAFAFTNTYQSFVYFQF